MNRNGPELIRAAQEVFRDSLVSVVMPTYNQAEFLPEALASVLNQTHRNLQVIVVDDGSTDETPAFLRTIIDPRVEVIRHRKNRGLPATLNTGFAQIRGRFATWTSSDNLMRPHCIATLYETLRANPRAGLAHANYSYLGARERLGDTSGVSFDTMYYLGRPVPGPAFLLHTSILTHLADRAFDESLMGIEDTAWKLELARITPFVHAPEVLYEYRVYRGQLTPPVEPDEGYRPLLHEMQDRFDQRHRPPWRMDEALRQRDSLRVLYVFPHCCHGGVEAVVLNRVRGLQDLGVECEFCVACDIGGSRIFEGVCPCHVLGTDAEVAFGKLSKLVRGGKYDVIALIHYPEALRALADAGFRGTILYECHGSIERTNFPGLQLCDALLTITRTLKKAFKSLGARVPVRVVPNAVDVQQYANTTKAFPQASQFGAIGARVREDRVLAWAGRLAPEKNYPLLLDVYAELAGRNRNLALWFAGGGESEAGPEELQHRVGDLGLADRFRWFPIVEPDHMPRFYRGVANSRGLFILPSKEEALGMVLLEAMASGVPVIASRVGGVPEVVEHGRTGLLVRPGSRAALRQAIERLLRDDALYDRLAKNGAMEVARRFNLPEHVAELNRLYRSLITAPVEDVVVVVSGVDWEDTGGGQRPRKLAEAFAAMGKSVIFISLKGKTYGDYGHTKVFALSCLLDLPNPCAHELPRDLSWWARRYVEVALRRCHPVLVVNCAYTRLSQVVTETIRDLGARVVYDCIDLWPEFARMDLRHGVDIGYDEETEREVASQADLVTVSARSLRTHLRKLCGKRLPVLYLPNALDFAYAERTRAERPLGLPKADRVFGFVGSLWGEWLDWDLVSQLAQLRPRWQFVFVGPRATAVDARFARTKNVLLIGEKPHTTLHRYVDHFDAGLIPYRLTTHTRAVSPIKVFDYLGRSKPVVASRLPELRGYPAVTCASGVDEWLEALEKVGPRWVPPEDLQAFLSRNTWERRAEAIWTGAMK
ncbi:MAG: glycosyltransferase [Armatimonadetes bacterium]|nr:glycosyltransferase [Armatimonadota bacterium]